MMVQYRVVINCTEEDDMFDYRGLIPIPMGLALEATKNMYAI